jgi:hypothetical protein
MLYGKISALAQVQFSSGTVLDNYDSSAEFFTPSPELTPSTR